MRDLYPRSGPWETLEQAFRALTVDELKILASALPGPRIGGRKAERIERLCRCLTGDSLRDLWSRLSELQQAAVALAVHNPDASFNPEGFRLRYDQDPDLSLAGMPLRHVSVNCAGLTNVSILAGLPLVERVDAIRGRFSIWIRC